MKRYSRFWKPKPPAHIRGWGAGPKHSEPFAKRNIKRRLERLFTIKAKRQLVDQHQAQPQESS